MTKMLQTLQLGAGAVGPRASGLCLIKRDSAECFPSGVCTYPHYYHQVI